MDIYKRCKALEESIAQLTLQVPFGLHQLDKDGFYLSVNEQELVWLGYSKQDLIGKIRFSDLLAMDSRQRYESVLANPSSHSLISEHNITVLGKNTLLSNYTLHVKVLFDVNSIVSGYQCTLFISTDRSLIDRQLRIAATVFESIEGMLVTDDRNLILMVNSAFTNITGYKAEDVIGQNPSILSSGLQDTNFYREMWKALADQGHWSGELLNRHKDGSIYPEFLSISAVKNLDGKITNYVGVFSDITERKKTAERLEHLGFYDPLTGLPNRRLLVDQLKRAVDSSERTGKQGAVLFIDLDEFKDINNTLGHDAGDEMLIEVAKRLRHCVRKSDTIARLGGDEFVIVLEGLSKDKFAAAIQVEATGEQIKSTLNHVYYIAKHELHNSPSIGAVVFQSDKKTIEELLKKADIAMYQAKLAGRNRMMFFDQQMQDAIHSRSLLNYDLHRAIEDKQFLLYYQIQVNETGNAIGVEGLIRWQHPERGLITPNQFIPFAEETSMILAIGHWVLETACVQLQKWQSMPTTCDLVLSVNVSAMQFKQDSFVKQLQGMVHQYGINPRRLKLEITESMLLDDIEDVIANISILQNDGISFSLDDFGTGYSSLQYLQRLPLDQLKIDLSFVRHIESNANDLAIVATIIAMAASLDMQVIAEGVENENQRDILLNKGCKHYQGYLFSKPVPIAEFEALLEQRPTQGLIGR